MPRCACSSTTPIRSPQRPSRFLGCGPRVPCEEPTGESRHRGRSLCQLISRGIRTLLFGSRHSGSPSHCPPDPVRQPCLGRFRREVPAQVQPVWRRRLTSDHGIAGRSSEPVAALRTRHGSAMNTHSELLELGETCPDEFLGEGAWGETKVTAEPGGQFLQEP